MLGYDIYAFGRMIRDNVRTDAYAEALRRAVGPTSVVLDMGTGVGIWTLLACKFGARKVFAVDPNDAIQIAREIVAANGYADRVEFIQDLTTTITLPEPADVIVAEMHGIVPMFEQNLPAIIDARRRLLAPGGKMIPQKETLWAAPVEAPESYDQVVLPWANDPYGFEWDPALRIAVNDWFKIKDKIAPGEFFGEPKCWATLDYTTLESPNVAGKLSWTATRAGVGHGLAVWFDTLLIDDVAFSNAPGSPQTIFGQAFFPWSEPISISEGNTISVVLRCDLLDNYHLWRWQTNVSDHGQGAKVKADFKQSTFFGMPLSPALSKREPEYVPKLSQDGEIQQFVLSLMNGRNSVETIIRQTAIRFANRFASGTDAATVVSELSQKYTE
jgi:type I protein arginine methyltransferase